MTALVPHQERLIRGKLAFKTQQTHWVNTEEPVIILVSMDSVFHNPIEGDLKMHALLKTIKQHVKGKITVLLSDQAHVEVLSLKNENNMRRARKESLQCAERHFKRYRAYFMGCNIEYESSYIQKDRSFTHKLKLVQDLYRIDPSFRDYVGKDALASYTSPCAEEYSNQQLFIEKAINDILGQCACLLVLAHKGYRFLFYPGPSNESMEYINRVAIPHYKQVSWVDVFLSIEKKTVRDLNKNESSI